MMFEGSEKKLEIVVSEEAGSLRQMGDEFWKEIVKSAKASILSKMSSGLCDSYILSESSLFVWDNRFTLITCGTTTLSSAVVKFFESVSSEHIVSLIFERKNEYFPKKQHSDFHDDISGFEKLLEGSAYRFGYANEHHLHLYHLNKPYCPDSEDTTLELLMYDPQGSAKSALCKQGQSCQAIRDVLDLRHHLGDFEIDDHVFDPCGYSVNALRGSDYYTIHVTPQDDSSFVSFETNLKSNDNYREIIGAVLGIFHPRTFDVVQFNKECLSDPLQFDHYQIKNHVQERLNCGYHVDFRHYYQPLAAPNRAHRVNQAVNQETNNG